MFQLINLSIYQNHPKTFQSHKGEPSSTKTDEILEKFQTALWMNYENPIMTIFYENQHNL